MTDDLHGAALVKLLDDTDPEVIKIVWNKIIETGPGMLPYLEEQWSMSQGTQILEYIEELIRILRLQELSAGIKVWMNNPEASLLEGSLFVSQIQYPELNLQSLKDAIQPLRNEIWLEISQNLTALEKIKVINHFLFEKLGFKLNLKQPDSPGNHFLNRLIETRLGNPISITLLYAIICQDIGLPVYGVNIPGSIVLVYHDLPGFLPVNKIPEESTVLFYVNPANLGGILGHRDIMFYLIQNKLSTGMEFFRASSNHLLIQKQLNRLKADFLTAGNRSRAEHIDSLLNLWKENPKEFK